MFDCAVIGAGAFGSWTALRLRETGRRVALVEAIAPGNPKSSSGGASRVIRMGYGADEIYTRWSRRSLADWKELAERAGRRDLFQPTGVLWTALRGHPYGEATLQMLAQERIAHEVLSSGELQQRYPMLRFQEDVLAILEPESGALLANQAVRAVAEEAQRIGVESIEGKALPFPEKGRLERLTTDSGIAIEAGTFIFACGPWLPKLFPEAVGGRIRVTRQPIFYFDAPGIAMPVWIDFTDPRGAYTIPPMDGKSFKLALDQHGAPFDPDTGSRTVTAEETAAARAFLAERFPALRDAEVLETEVCQYESTSSGDFLIDRHPAMTNVWLVGGGSGHGFKHGPAVGAYAAAAIGGADGEPRFRWASKSKTAERRVY
ncbi:MAG TPA: FAD-dependent oxidoreductase [Bryobacteraceae bacterium]|nr:FAD-dependent oxidoreductase [Bryobacteraceae bacterium]